ncbi:MAG TPA: hypothetical protein DCM38_03460 [Gammaproteobacteria bacterium]|nr:hypothetical protein [Gammaproteobacteria bacterium]
MIIAKAQLKQEIDRLDEQYLELVYNILRQLSYLSPPPPSVEQVVTQGVNRLSLLDVLARLEEIEDEFPDVDTNLLPLDDITL